MEYAPFSTFRFEIKCCNILKWASIDILSINGL